MNVVIRPEGASDAGGIRAVLEAAFETALEADLVELLRARGKALVSLVAGAEGRIVGHILFSPVSVASPKGTVAGAGLAPVAVLPPCQKQGIGSRLIREGLAACREADCPFAVVLGEPAYYQRFGFRRASDFGIGNEYGVDEEFMVIELRDGGLPSGGGVAKYAPEFAEVEP
jgi:putative acetyltransferase